MCAQLSLQRLRTLVIDDDEIDLDMLCGLVKRAGPGGCVLRAKTLQSAMELMSDDHPTMIILDDYLGLCGRAVTNIHVLRRAGFRGLICVASNHFDRRNAPQLLRTSGVMYFDKDEINESWFKGVVEVAENVHLVWK